MDINLLLISAGAAFIYVFLKATQQLNVVHGNKALIYPVSIGMGICEVAIVLLVVKADSIFLGFTNGLAGGSAALLAMYLHKKLPNGL